MFYTLIRFIVINFGTSFGKLDDYHGYKFHLITILFPSVCTYDVEKLTIGNFQLKRPKRKPHAPIWNKYPKPYRAIREYVDRYMHRYEWDEEGDFQIIPSGFVMTLTDSEFLFQDTIHIGFRIKLRKDWRTLDDHLFIGIRMRYGEDW